ncbi:MAG TPA: hypothetical protein VFU49_22135 [Ktedonobacteraceae bacterium]|nr:hypothetical protein [Ktedonobacteraceae bacterium]
MSQSDESVLSSQDRAFIAVKQFGNTLAIYRVRPGYIRFLYRISWLMIIMSIFILIMGSVWTARGFQEFQFSILFISFLTGLTGLLVGIYCLRSMVPQTRQDHIIVCEQGLLRVVGTKCTDAVRWTEVKTVEKEFFNQIFSIVYAASTFSGMKTLSISSLYHKFDEIIVRVKENIA